MIVAIAWPAYRYHQPIYRWAAWQYWFRQCLAHQMPANIQLRDKNLEQKVALKTSHPDYCDGEPARGWITSTVYSPRAFVNLSMLDGRTYVGAGLAPAVAFLGERTRPDGERRLVIVRNDRTNGFDLLRHIHLTVLPVPSLFDTPHQTVNLNGGESHSGLFTPAAIESCTADPVDRTHVIVPFVVFKTNTMGSPWTIETDEVKASGIIDAYLTNDDTLRVQLRENSVTGDATAVHLVRSELRDYVNGVDAK